MQTLGRQPGRAPDGTPVHYERHRPEQNTLYRLVQKNVATFIAQVELASGCELPQFIKDEFDAFLECGILAHGFLRLRCEDCGHDKLVAFSVWLLPVLRRTLYGADGRAFRNIHLHCLLLDGVYRRSADGEPQFVEVAAPSNETVQAVLHQIITRMMMKLLTRQGVLVQEQCESYLADNDSDSNEAVTLECLQTAACTYRIAFGARAGQKVLTLQGTKPRAVVDFKQNLCANFEGFSLHAGVRCAADQRKTLERLCRYITRPALANERVQCNASGQVVLTLKTPTLAFKRGHRLGRPRADKCGCEPSDPDPAALP